MIKWKLYRDDENLKRVFDVTLCTLNPPIWLDKLENEEITLYGLLLTSRKIKTTWSLEQNPSISMNFGKDLEKEITTALGAEMRKETDNEIMRTLTGDSNKNGKQES